MGPDSLERRLPAEVSDLCEAFERSPDAVFVTDRRNRIVFSNRAAEALLGFSAGESVGLSCEAVLKGRDVFDNRYCALNCPVMQMAARGEIVRDFRLRIEARDGGEVTLELSVLQLVVASPEHYYLAHVLRPVERTGRAPVSPEAEPRPPRSTLEVVRESTDVRARRLTAREVEVLGHAGGRPDDSGDLRPALHLGPDGHGTTSRTSWRSSRSTPRARRSPSRSRSG